MKKFILIVFMALMCATSFGQLNEKAKIAIKEYAKDKWGTDYAMVNYEIDKQVEAGDEFFRKYNALSCWREDNKSDECLILITAYGKWSDERTGWVDWEMTLYEANKQLDAYYKLK